MQTRIARKPQYAVEQNPPNRAGVTTPGPKRYATGPHAGKIVPTRRNPVHEVTCERCKLPSYRGLRPFVRAIGYDRKTGKPVVQYVHDVCPRNVAVNKKLIAKFREADRKRAAELAKLPHGGRTWSVKRLFGR